jgi:soluble lytic murein transglycosylase-like protein
MRAPWLLLSCAVLSSAFEASDGAIAAQLAAAARQRAAVAQQAAAIGIQRAAAGRRVEPACDRLAAADAHAIVASASARSGVPAPLLHAVIEQESGFRPCAVSTKGALGLMQLLPSTAGELGVRDAFDPLENAGSGARFLARLIDRYRGDLRLALAAYNAGPARVDSHDGVPDIPETRNYVRNILTALGLAESTAP